MSTHENERALEPERVAPDLAEQEQSDIYDPYRRLPPELQIKMRNLQPGAPEAIVALARQYPEFVDAILMQAIGLVGNSTMQAATDLLAKNPITAADAPVRGVAPKQDLSYDGFDYASSVLTLEGGDVIADHIRFIDMHPHLRGKVIDGFSEANPRDLDELLRRLAVHENEKGGDQPEQEKQLTEDEAADDQSTAAPKADKGESKWIAGAKRFNAAHHDEVNEFNIMTDYSCGAPGGIVDPALVSDWQLLHGLTPDGRIGPATVEAARRAAGVIRRPVMTQKDIDELE